MSTLSNIVAFATGAAVGALVAWKLLENKYDKLIQEEVDSVKEAFASYRKDEEKPETDESAEFEEAVEKYEAILDEAGYIDYSAKNKTKGGESDMKDKKPYVIPPEEYGEIYEYDTRNLTYYENGVLTDEDDNVIDDVEGMIGTESLNHFGDYEPDSVHVRNDKLKVDYEILKDGTSFKRD